MRRARNARRDHAGLAREARQPDLRHQLQPAAARRPGARQRQDHSGAGRRLPRRRLERHQGHLGRRLGSAAGQRRNTACSCKRMGEVVDGEYQKYVVIARRATFASTSSASIPSWPSWSSIVLGREAAKAAPRRPRSGKGLRRLQGRRRMQGQADRHPGQDDQGLRPGRSAAKAAT